MPLPFSFSTQRQFSGAPVPEGSEGLPAIGHALQNAPQQISTEPMDGAFNGGAVVFPPAYAISHEVMPRPRSAPVIPPPAPSPNQRSMPQEFVTATLQLAKESFQAQQPQAPELMATNEQIRNDVFAIATNVSALSDRLSRLEQQRGPSAATQGVLDTLRSEIQSWLENHLPAVVEHCLHQMLSRNPLPQSPPHSH